MNTVQLYKNPYPYPTYTRTLTKYKDPFQATPRNMNLQTGYVDLPLTFADVNNCNYLSFTRDGITVYAWIMEAEEIGGNNRFRIKYNTDALRTFLPKVNLGAQYVERGPGATLLYDELLGSADPHPEVTSTPLYFENDMNRTLVVQVKRGTGAANWDASNTPGQPTLYDFFCTNYDVQNPLANSSIKVLMEVCRETDPYLVVTAYSIPKINLAGLPVWQLHVNDSGWYSEGWKWVPDDVTIFQRLSKSVLIPIPQGLTKTDSSVSIVIPEAGVLPLPVELYNQQELYLRRDVDIFSGLANYMYEGYTGETYPYSVRGGATASIPIIGDPLQTYISQNQNSLATAVIGDVATIAGGVGLIATGGGAGVGAGAVFVGAKNLISRQAQIKDAAASHTNPPAFLGTALAPRCTGVVYMVIKKSKVDNAANVNSNFGYPQNRVMTLAFPSSGYIQTRNCRVTGAIPRWAIEEINGCFDTGILVK